MRTIRRHSPCRSRGDRGRLWLRLLSALALFFQLVPSTLQAQQGIQVGWTGAYEFGLDPMRSSNATFSSWCNCADDGARLSHAAWLAAIVSHSTLFGENFGLASSLRFGWISSVFVARSPRLSPSGNPVEFQENLRTSVLQLDLSGTVRLSEQVLVTLGPTFDIPVVATGSTLERELSADGGVIEGNDRPLGLPVSDDALDLSYGVVAKGVMQVPLGGAATMSPAIHASFNFSRLRDGEPLGAVMIGGSTSVLFDVDRIFAPQPATSVPPLPEPAPPPVKAPPTASIELFAVDGHGNRSDRMVIYPKRERHRRQMPVPSTLMFVEQSEDFAEPYRLDHRMTDGDIAFDSLAYLGVGEIELQGLNIVGSRLKADPAAQITLIAVTTAAEPTATGVARAKKIRRYLNEGWGIEENRIKVRTVSTRHGERSTPVVQIASTSHDILAPIEAEWFEERYAAPRISMRRDIHADAGVRRWRVDVHCGNRVVSSTTSDSLSGEAPTIAFDLSDYRVGSGPEPLVARLVVEDSSGAIITATDELAITIEQQPKGGMIGEQLRYVVPARLISGPAQRSSLVKSLTPVIRPGAEVTIALYHRSGAPKLQPGNEVEQFVAELRRRVGSSNVTIRLEESPAGSGETSQPGYDLEIAVVQSVP